MHKDKKKDRKNQKTYFEKNLKKNLHNQIVFHIFDETTNKMKTSLINQLVANFANTLSPSSKWFTQDVADFKANVSKLTVKELEVRLGRLTSLNDEKSSFNKKVRKEVSLLNKGGMFEMSKMKAANCLD